MPEQEEKLWHPVLQIEVQVRAHVRRPRQKRVHRLVQGQIQHRQEKEKNQL